MKSNSSAYISQDFVASSTNGWISTTTDAKNNQSDNKKFHHLFLPHPMLSPVTHGSFSKKWLIHK